MEVVHQDQEVMGSSHDYLHVVKGKRTKRQRPFSPQTFPITTSSSSGGGGGGGGGGASGAGGGDDRHNFSSSSSSPTTSVEFSGRSEEEEEDMANCLILLAQGGHDRDGSKQIDESGGLERISSRRFVDTTTTTTTSKGGLCVYECKTCNRCFPSFQALGGHRASHKRPNKQTIVEEKKASSVLAFLEAEESQFNETSPSPPSLTLQMGNSSTHLYNNSSNKSRVHECSICGSEFSSGQALGGHMRRHRTSNAAVAASAAAPTTTTTTTNMSHHHHQEITKKQKNVLTLDLNLPAPEEDRESKFLFSSKQQPLIFSASPLVDCHY